MAELRIQWDEVKTRANMRKHKISVEEAATVSYDEHTLPLADETGVRYKTLINLYLRDCAPLQ